MIHKDIVEKWIQGAVDAVKMLDKDADYDLVTGASSTASACAQIACAMSLVRIADALEKLVEQKQGSIV